MALLHALSENGKHFNNQRNNPEKIWQRRKLKERGMHVHLINHGHVWGNNNHGGIEDWVVQHA